MTVAVIRSSKNDKEGSRRTSIGFHVSVYHWPAGPQFRHRTLGDGDECCLGSSQFVGVDQLFHLYVGVDGPRESPEPTLIIASSAGNDEIKIPTVDPYESTAEKDLVVIFCQDTIAVSDKHSIEDPSARTEASASANIDCWK